MYNKQEASLLKEQFWTSFGLYMAPIPSAEAVKINWVNYKTGIKDLHFKMYADNEAAIISIVLTQADAERQTVFFKQLMSVKNILKDALQEDWQWALHAKDEHHKTISHVYISLGGVSIFKKEDWPLIISFFKPRMMALDAFWNDVKFGFEVL